MHVLWRIKLRKWNVLTTTTANALLQMQMVERENGANDSHATKRNKHIISHSIKLVKRFRLVDPNKLLLLLLLFRVTIECVSSVHGFLKPIFCISENYIHGKRFEKKKQHLFRFFVVHHPTPNQSRNSYKEPQPPRPIHDFIGFGIGVRCSQVAAQNTKWNFLCGRHSVLWICMREFIIL